MKRPNLKEARENMKNDEFVTASNIADYPQLMCERRLFFVTALMEECRLLQHRIDQEKLAMASGFAEFVWEGSVHETRLPPTGASVAALAELNSALDNLSKIDHILNDIAAQVGGDQLAYGNML